MSLEIKQNTNLQRITLDVWQDLVFLNEQAYPAGYFAANIMKIEVYTAQAYRNSKEIKIFRHLRSLCFIGFI